MKATQLTKALATCYAAGRAPNIQGPPGCGKTSIVRQFAAGIGADLLVLDLPMIYDPVDTRGIPCNVNGTTVWLPPDYIHSVVTNGSHPYVIFVDDYGNCPPTSQANLMSLFLDRRLGGHTLPDSVFVVAAGNRVTDATAVHATPSALANRMTWLTLTVDLQEWCNWALLNDIETSLIAFHRFTGGANLYPTYNGSDAQATCGLCSKTLGAQELCSACTRNHHAFPSPRSWAFVSDILRHSPGEDIELELFAGNVGQAKALEFAAYLRMFRQLPSIDSILLGPKIAPVPDDPAAMYAVATALGRVATAGNMDAINQYLTRCHPEYSVLAIRDAVNRDRSLCNTRAFQAWATKYSDVLL